MSEDACHCPRLPHIHIHSPGCHTTLFTCSVCGDLREDAPGVELPEGWTEIADGGYHDIACQSCSAPVEPDHIEYT